MRRLIIVGTSSTANVVYKFIRKYKLFDVVGFAVNESYKNEDKFCGLPVYSLENLHLIIDKVNDYLFVAIQWNNLNADRRKVFENLKQQGYRFANIISPNAIIDGRIEGENCWICDQVIINFDSVVYDNTFIKTGAYVSDNVSIGPHCFIGARALLGGGVIVGAQSFIGLSATVFDDVCVGDKCIVGATTAVKRNLENYSVIKTKMTNCEIRCYSTEIIESKLQFRKNVR